VSNHDLLRAHIRVKTIRVLDAINKSANHFVKKSLTYIKKQGEEKNIVFWEFPWRGNSRKTIFYIKNMAKVYKIQGEESL
jgi:hypothetical protein